MSTIISGSNKRKKFKQAYHTDDVRPIDVEPLTLDTIRVEVDRYRRSVTLTNDEKDKLNVLKWWRDNSSTFPYLYLAVKATLSIPATSVLSERIFSLAGFILNKRRSQLLTNNVNMYIFLNRNREYISEKTPVLTPTEIDTDNPGSSQEVA